MSVTIPDWRAIGENFKDYLSNPLFIGARSQEELCRILDHAELTYEQFNIFFCNLIYSFQKKSISDILKHITLKLDLDINETSKALRNISRVLELPALYIISQSILMQAQNNQQHILFQRNDQINNHIMQHQEPEEAQEFHRNPISNRSRSVEQNQIQDPPVNESVVARLNPNINCLMMTPKTQSNFHKIYNIFDNIAKSKDVTAMRFAIENGYHNITDGCNNILTESACLNNFPLAKMLAVNGADINETDSNGFSALNYFCSKGNLSAVEYFARIYGVNPNSPSNGNWTTLMAACSSNRIPVIRFLLTLDGIDINARNINGSTALSMCRSDAARQLMIAYGAV